MTVRSLEKLVANGTTGKYEVKDTDGVVSVEINGVKVLTTQQATIAALTAASGTADGTVDDVGGTFVQATLNNNFQEMATKINAILVALKAHGFIA